MPAVSHLLFFFFVCETVQVVQCTESRSGNQLKFRLDSSYQSAGTMCGPILEQGSENEQRVEDRDRPPVIRIRLLALQIAQKE